MEQTEHSETKSKVGEGRSETTDIDTDIVTDTVETIVDIPGEATERSKERPVWGNLRDYIRQGAIPKHASRNVAVNVKINKNHMDSICTETSRGERNADTGIRTDRTAITTVYRQPKTNMKQTVHSKETKSKVGEETLDATDIDTDTVTKTVEIIVNIPDKATERSKKCPIWGNLRDYKSQGAKPKRADGNVAVNVKLNKNYMDSIRTDTSHGERNADEGIPTDRTAMPTVYRQPKTNMKPAFHPKETVWTIVNTPDEATGRSKERLVSGDLTGCNNQAAKPKYTDGNVTLEAKLNKTHSIKRKERTDTSHGERNAGEGIRTDRTAITTVNRQPKTKMKQTVHSKECLENEAPVGRKPKNVLNYNSPLWTVCQLAKINGNTNIKDLINSHRTWLLSHVPCVYCSTMEAHRTTSRTVFSSLPNMHRNGMCVLCGRRMTTLASLDASIKQLRSAIKESEFVVFNVFPDGNCLFSAINDQLRIQGHFEHSIDSLRQAAFDHLRTSITETELPFSTFLTNETSTDYLERMSKNGEWADQMILEALCDVLQRRIVIYGGTTGRQVTTIAPKVSIGDVVLERRSDINIGQFAELHYVSLRSRTWMNDIDKVVEQSTPANIFSIDHANFLLGQVFQSGYVKSHDEAVVDTIVPTTITNGTGSGMFHIVGLFVSKMAPDIYTAAIESGMDVLFPTETNYVPPEPAIFLFSPKDTDIKVDKDSAGRADLVLDGDITDRHFKLVPKKPKVWEGQLKRSGETFHLTRFDIDFSNFSYQMLTYEVWSTVWKRVVTCVIAFHMEWPNSAMEWITRDRPSGLLNDKAINDIYQIGCHAVPAVVEEDDVAVICDSVPLEYSDDDTVWCISFAVAERELSRYISPAQRCCYLAFKSLVDLIAGNYKIPYALSTSVFFYACEAVEREKWKRHPGHCLMVLLKKMHDGFQNECLPHYFLANKNLLNGFPANVRKEITAKLEVQIFKPMLPLFKVLNMQNITSSDIGPLVEDVITDMAQFEKHYDVTLSARDVFLPAVCNTVQTMVNKFKYDDAFSFLQALQHTLCDLTGDISMLETLAISAMESMTMCQKWGFALFMDISVGSTLTWTVCKNIPHLHIADVFGPDAADIVLDTIVPTEADIGCGSLVYPESLLHLLFVLGSHVATIPCLKFYLQTYTLIAGDAILVPVNNREMQSEIAVSKIPLFEGFSEISKYLPEEPVQKLMNRGLLVSLYAIYEGLFNTCLRLNRVEEFREFVPRFKQVAQVLQEPKYMTFLEVVSKYFV